MPETDLSAEEQQYVAQQRAEYGTYVANYPITHEGALAYAAGQPVPVSNVEKYGYLADGLVRRVDDAPPVVTVAAVEVPKGADIELGAVEHEPGEQPEQPEQPEPTPDLNPESGADPSADL